MTTAAALPLLPLTDSQPSHEVLAQLGASSAAMHQSLSDLIADARESLHTDVRDVHVELLRQFQLMQVIRAARRARARAPSPERRQMYSLGAIVAPRCLRRRASMR